MSENRKWPIPLIVDIEFLPPLPNPMYGIIEVDEKFVTYHNLHYS